MYVCMNISKCISRTVSVSSVPPFLPFGVGVGVGVGVAVAFLAAALLGAPPKGTPASDS